MSVRIDRPPIALSNRFACLEEEESRTYSRDDLLALREVVPKEDPDLKARIEAIMEKVDVSAARKVDSSGNQSGKTHYAGRQRVFYHSKDPAYRHFHTKKIWVPKNPSKK